MLRNALTVAAVAAFLAAPAAHAQSEARTLLMPGVTYSRQLQFTPHGPVVVHVVTAPRPGGLYSLRPLLSNEAVQGRERLTAMERRFSGQATIVAANGDRFSAGDGHPSGGLIRGRVMDTSTDPERSAAGIDLAGVLHVDRVLTSGTWKGTGQRRPLSVNRPPLGGTTTLYTRAWGPATPAEAGAVQAVLSPFPPSAPNTNLQAPVVDLHAGGPTTIPPGGAVLVARGAQAGKLSAEAPVGTSVSVRLNLAPDWTGVTDAIGGGPVLVQGGRPVYDSGEDFTTAQLLYRQARTAVGQTADGRILLVAVDGRTGTSAGMTNWELALTMFRLGAVTAMSLDGGTSTTLAFDGGVLNRPPAGEQPIADALAVFYSGVYAAPPLVDAVSPNGDGADDDETFAYKVVRPSTVTATLVAPDGTTRTLATGADQPGTRQLPWKPDQSTPEGRWIFRVTATDDQSRTSTAERLFTVNQTLAQLAVAPSVVQVGRGGGRLAVAFTLARSAEVRVTVETRSGSVVATIANRSFDGARQQVTWNGRVGSRAVPSGQYVVRVRAENELGDVDLIAPFRARRR